MKTGAKICAWILVFLLTAGLTVTVAGTLGVQALTNEELHIRAATDEGIIRGQMERILEEIDLLAEEYGFSAERVKETIREDEIRELNRETAIWWTRMITEGETESAPKWKTGETTQAIYESMTGTRSGEEALSDSVEASEIIAKEVQTAVAPTREVLLITGVGYVNRRADIPAILRTAVESPMLGLVSCLLAAGLIALLAGGRIREGLKFFGTALAGTGISLVGCGIAVKIINMEGMIRKAAEGLANEYAALTRSVMWEGILLTAGLFIGGMLCLALYRRGTGREENGETEAC